jgi:ubiquinone/menaquinone biosynthesis C-methylase UbiE
LTKDRFSNHAQQYATFRPTYPKALYDFIFKHVRKFDSAWDCGTGNGQVARDLSAHFKIVEATDISEKQLANAFKAENIFYSKAGEKTTFPDHQFNLITVAQAIHWFDIPKFYEEVQRVGKKNAIIAVWGYSLLSINPEIDKQLHDFYFKIVGPYWDKERRLVDEQYKTIPFPFTEIASPEFKLSFEWTIAEFQGYLSTWSSVQKYIQANQINPVESFMKKILPLWKSDRQSVNFPLFLRLGKISS